MKRIKSDPIAWHVIARGARRLDLFRDDEDFGTFLAMLSYSLKAADATLWAFTLMTNHYHLVVFASSMQLTACMQRLNRSYSRYHNEKYELIGHAFDGAYKCYRQPTPLLLLRTIAYVFMNPVVAGMTARPENYPWSSVRDYLHLPGAEGRVDPSNVMSYVSKDSERAWAYFHRAMDREIRRPKRVAPDALSRVQIHAQQFEWLLEHAHDSKQQLQGEDPIRVAMYWARQSGITPKAMSKVLPDFTPAQISRLLFEMRTELSKDPARAQRLALP